MTTLIGDRTMKAHSAMPCINWHSLFIFRATAWRECLLSPSSASAVLPDQHLWSGCDPVLHQTSHSSSSPNSRAASRLSNGGPDLPNCPSTHGMRCTVYGVSDSTRVSISAVTACMYLSMLHACAHSCLLASFKYDSLAPYSLH